MKRQPIPAVTAIIPARGGSRGLPRKNLLPLAGIPLVARAILAARRCPYIGCCLLSTEDPEIRAIGLDYGVTIVERPAELAGDLATSEDVIRHSLSHAADEFFVLLQPTSPLRTSTHITACIETFFASDAESAISVTEAKESPYKAFIENGSGLEPLFDADRLHVPRQTLPRVYNQNGAIYLTSTAAFLRTNRLFIPPVMPFVMDAACSIDIDTSLDWRIAECLISA